MRFYNTQTRKIEEFKPRDKNHVKMYTCGPTVYHFAHIGNLRSYICEDILEKSLNYLGYHVDRCMNITDVGHLSSDSDSGEDKMLKGAKREHKTVLEIADFYTKAFFDDLENLNIKKPEIISKATDNIDSYIEIIKTLLKKEYAYESNGNIYFDTTKLEDYYTLTNHKEDSMVVGAREGVLEDKNKKNQNDFVLWFTKSKFEDQELKWDSPFGYGYPGWHIECSGISIKYLGEYLDIHCGGVDNIFPHHTNEIAQSEAYLGHKWCNYWFHVEHLNDETGKMSKSKGDFLTVSKLIEKGYDPIVYRMMCLQSHYSKPLLFTYEVLDNIDNAYKKLKNKINSLQNKKEEIKDVEKYDSEFKKALEDNLNTSLAITVLYDVLKSDLNDTSKLYLIEKFDSVLSLNLLKKEKISSELELIIKEKIEERNEAKKNKNYVLADQIRQELLDMGIIIKDTREGTIYEISR